MIPSSLFTVPIWDETYPDYTLIKDELVDKLKQYVDAQPTLVRSNVAGKHSNTLAHQQPAFQDLFSYISTKVNAAAASIGMHGTLVIMESWININDTPGCFNLQHIHGGVLSGTFYVQVPKGSGNLYLTNPAPINLWEGFNMTQERNHFFSETIEVNPVEGTLIIWPSYLPHTVGPNTDNVERISIAFNTTIYKANS